MGFTTRGLHVNPFSCTKDGEWILEQSEHRWRASALDLAIVYLPISQQTLPTGIDHDALCLAMYIVLVEYLWFNCGFLLLQIYFG